MKSVAIILNLILIVVVIGLVVKHPPSGSDILLFGLLFAAPISSLLALLFENKLSESWMGLYFKRKRLEEKKKIEDLGAKP